MTVARVAKNNFGDFSNLVMSKVQPLNDHVQSVIQTGDFEAADQFTEIFIELAFSNMEQIIDQGSPLLDILISLLEMAESDCYAQLPFWRDLFRRISRIEDETQRLAKFQNFEQVVIKLVNLIIKRAKMEDGMFVDFNKISSN